MDSDNGLNRRDVLKRGAIVGSAVLWAVPAVQVIGLGASHAEAASGGGGSTPAPPTQPPTHHTDVVPAPTPTPSPTSSTSVQGINFEQPPPAGNPPAATPTATLPFTGAAVPVTGAVALGAGLVATGVAAVAATRRRQDASAAGASDAAGEAQLPAV